jgi:hypothetical protein
MINAVLWFLFYPLFRRGRYMLHKLPAVEMRHHVHMILWGKTIAATFPVLFISLDSVACVTESASLGSCESVVQPGLTLGYHIMCYTAATAFFLPFVKISASRVMRLDLPVAVSIQAFFFIGATLTALFSFSTGYNKTIPILGFDPFAVVSGSWQFIFCLQVGLSLCKPGQFFSWDVKKSSSRSEFDEINEIELQEQKAREADMYMGDDGANELVGNMTGDGGMLGGGLIGA